MKSQCNRRLDTAMPSRELLEAKRAALEHYGRLVLLAEDAAAGRRSHRVHSAFAGIGVSDDAIRLYLYDSIDHVPEIVSDFGGFPTQVVHTPGFRPAPTTRRRPAPGGVSISLSYQRAAGTFGCLLEHTSGDRYLLSNNHVIADINAAPIGSRIVQPSILDGGVSPRDDLALLAAFQPIDFAGANRIDAAVGALPDPAAAKPGVLAIGAFADPPSTAFVGQPVHKHGARPSAPPARSSTRASTGSSTTDPPAPRGSKTRSSSKAATDRSPRPETPAPSSSTTPTIPSRCCSPATTGTRSQTPSTRFSKPLE